MYKNRINNCNYHSPINRFISTKSAYYVPPHIYDVFRWQNVYKFFIFSYCHLTYKSFNT